MKTQFKKNSFILAGVSALVLASCLPQDDAVLSERALENTESQIQQYSKAFHQFTNRSMNALVNSALWDSGAVGEGAIDLTNADFGSLNLGQSGAYLASAHCKDAGGLSYHLSWFNQADESGNVSLKGLGSGNIGQANMRIKNMMPQGNFGVFDGGAVNMSDGSVFSLEGGCTTLNIPTGTAVAAMSLPTPNNMAVVEEVRTILRADACASGESGGVTQSIQAKFMNDGTIRDVASDKPFATESALIDDDTLSWTTIATDCQDNVAGLNRDSMNDSTSLIGSGVIRSFNVETTDNNIAAALQENLQTANCRRVALLDEETGGLNEESEEIFQTCGDEIDLAMLENSDTVYLINRREDFLTRGCGEISKSSSLFNSSTEHNFGGQMANINSSQLTIMGSPAQLSGSIDIKQVISTWESKVDIGDGSGGTTRQFETTELEGVSIDCSARVQASMTCAQMYPAVAGASNVTLLSGSPRTYSSVARISGWKEANALIPNDVSYRGGWNLISSSDPCIFQERTVSSSCSSRNIRISGAENRWEYSRTTETKIRTNTDGVWSIASATSSTREDSTCRPEGAGSSGGGGGGGGYKGDGVTDSRGEGGGGSTGSSGHGGGGSSGGSGAGGGSDR